MNEWLYWTFQGIAFVFAALYASVYEWAFHKYILHSPKIMKQPFVAHTLEHHQKSKWDETYHIDDYESEERISLGWYTFPLIMAIHLPLLFFLQYSLGVPCLWGVVLSFALYYGTYEYIHWCMHIPGGRWVEDTRVFKFLKEHHRLHHKFMLKNLNVVMPFADLVFGTLRLTEAPPVEKTKAVKRRQQVL